MNRRSVGLSVRLRFGGREILVDATSHARTIAEVIIPFDAH